MISELRDRRREIDLPIEPGFHDVLVRRLHIGQVTGCRDRVAGDDLAVEATTVAPDQPTSPLREKRRERRQHPERAIREAVLRLGLCDCQPGSEGFSPEASVAPNGACRRLAAAIAQRRVVEFLPATFAPKHVRFDERRVCVSSSPSKGAEQQLLICAGGHHFTLLDCSFEAFAAGNNSVASMERPRERRDMTVPIGTPVTSAISA